VTFKWQRKNSSAPASIYTEIGVNWQKVEAYDDDMSRAGREQNEFTIVVIAAQYSRTSSRILLVISNLLL